MAPGGLTNFIYVGTYGNIRALELAGQGTRTAWEDELKGTGFHPVHLYLFNPKNLLFAAPNGRVYCYDAANGSEIWCTKPQAQMGVFASDLMTLWSDGSMLISCSNGYVIALDLLNGNELWQSVCNKFRGRATCYAITGHKGWIFLGNAGEVRGYDRASGKEIWKNGLSGMGYNPISLAAYSGTPTGDGHADALFVGTSGYVVVLNMQDGTTRHKVNLSGTGYNPVALLLDPPNGTLYTASNGEMRCFQADSLTQMWRSNLPGMGHCWGHSLLFHEGSIIIGMAGKVAAVDKQTGQERWKASLPGCGFGFVTVGTCADPDIFICGSAGNLYGVAKSNGNVVWRDELSGMRFATISISSPNFNTDFNSSTLIQYVETERDQNKRG